MDMKLNFKEGKWMTEINVADFVHENLTPYEGDGTALFLSLPRIP